MYLFCFAMDPFFHYLNRIPGVISVQAYVDDTTIAGTAIDPKWICDVADVYRRVASAGFHIDCHTCFRSCINDQMKFLPRLVTTEELLHYWPTIVDSCEYGTLQEAISHSMQPGRCTRIVRISTADLRLAPADARQRDYHICVNLSYSQAKDVLIGVAMHETTALLVGSCACKSTSCVVTNHALSPVFLKTLDDTKYGAQSVTSQALALGLALLARRCLKNTCEWVDVSEAKTLRDISCKPFLRFENRLRLFRQPQFSIMARSTAFNTYILSVMPYTISYFGLTTQDVNHLWQLAVKFILRRHWLDAETMPYALKWLGVATVLDPGLAATIASTGLYLREGNSIEELTLDYSDPSSCNVRQKSIVCDLFRMWAPYVPFEHMISAVAHCQGPISAKLRRLKQCLLEGMIRAAQHWIAQKVEAEGWAGGINFRWLAKLSRIKRTWCNGICRFAVLRWALNQDDDVWLSLRGTRHNQPCQLCGHHTDIYPSGFWHSPICEHCIRSQMIAPVSLYADSDALHDLYKHEDRTQSNVCQLSARILNEHLNAVGDAANGNVPMNTIIRTALRAYFQHSLPTEDCVCRACGRGDNTVGHWSRGCIVPLIVVCHLLKLPRIPRYIGQIACDSDRSNAICYLLLGHCTVQKTPTTGRCISTSRHMSSKAHHMVD